MSKQTLMFFQVYLREKIIPNIPTDLQKNLGYFTFLPSHLSHHHL